MDGATLRRWWSPTIGNSGDGQPPWGSKERVRQDAVVDYAEQIVELSSLRVREQIRNRADVGDPNPSRPFAQWLVQTAGRYDRVPASGE